MNDEIKCWICGRSKKEFQDFFNKEYDLPNKPDTWYFEEDGWFINEIGEHDEKMYLVNNVCPTCSDIMRSLFIAFQSEREADGLDSEGIVKEGMKKIFGGAI